MQRIKDTIPLIAREAFSHPFTHGVAWLQVGSVLNRLIAFGTSLVFARMLGPEGYGYYSLVFAFAGTIMLTQDWGIGQGVTNLLAKAWAEKNRNDIKSLFSYFTKVSLVILATTGLVGTILSPWLGKWFYQDWELGTLTSIVVATGALTLFYPLIQIVLQVVGRIRQLTILETSYKLLLSLIPVGLIALGYSVFGIVTGQFLAMVIISIVSIVIYQRLKKISQLPNYLITQLLPSLKEWFTTKLAGEKISYYFKFGFQIAISKNLVKLNSSLPFLILGAVLSTASGLGYYKIAFAYMSLPIFLISPISRLLSTKLPEIEAKSSGVQLFKRFWQVTWISTGISVLLTLGAIMLGPFLIRFFYGQDFSPSIGIMYGLALYPIFSGLGVGLGAMFRTLNKMKAAISINLATLILLVPSSWYLINTYAIKGLVIITLLFTIFPNALSLAYFFWLSKKSLG